MINENNKTDKLDFSDWLIASDIDGTLNNKMRKLPERNRKAIKEFVEMGGHFTLASGRNPESMERHYRRLHIDTPAVVMNGAGIYDFRERKMIYFSSMSREAMEITIKAAKKFTVDTLIYTNETIYICGRGLFGRAFVIPEGLRHITVSTIDKVPLENWGKVVFTGFPWNIKKLKKFFDELEDPDMTIMSSSIASHELLARDTNKGTAVLKLAEMLGIEKDHTGGIGDYYNDYDMLKLVGVPACCGQAPHRLKRISEFVACHCNKGAVADFLEYIKSKKTANKQNRSK